MKRFLSWLFRGKPNKWAISPETVARLERRDRMIQDQTEARWDWPGVSEHLRRR